MTIATTLTPEREREIVLDFMMLGFVGGFFAIAVGYVFACASLSGSAAQLTDRKP